MEMLARGRQGVNGDGKVKREIWCCCDIYIGMHRLKNGGVSQRVS